LIFYGAYDVPVKGKGKEWLEGSEEVYEFIIGTVSPLVGDLLALVLSDQNKVKKTSSLTDMYHR